MEVHDCPAGTNEAGAAKGCQGCEGQAVCSASRDEPRDDVLARRMGAIRHKLLVLSGKGGVGKSSVAVQLAGELALSGKRVGLLDLDLCGPSLAQMLGVGTAHVTSSDAGWMPVKPPGFGGRLSVMSVAFLLSSSESAVIWRGPRKHATIMSFLKEVYWSKLDWLVIDTPPGTSDEHLTVVTALRDVAEGAVLVTTPSAVAHSMLRKELDFCDKLRLPVVGIVENMKGYLCPCCSEVQTLFPPHAGEDGVEQFAVGRGLRYLGSVPMDVAVGHAADEGRYVSSAAMQAVTARILAGIPEEDDC